MKFIKHLGFVDFVYPGATHSRFAHSLGVFHLACRFIENLKKQECGKIFADYEKDLRMAALLHDIGHFPFSHATDKDLWMRHETIGTKIIQNTGIREILEKEGYDLELITAQVEEARGEKQVKTPLYQLLGSDLDADRLDYLARDSLHTGIVFGKTDIENIIRNSTIQNDLLVFHDKAIRSIDHYLNARVSMFEAVYFHKTVMSLEVMYKEMLKILLKDAHEVVKDRLNLKILTQEKDLDVNAYLYYNDAMMLNFMQEDYKYLLRNERRGEFDNLLKEFYRRLLERDPYKLVFEVKSYIERDKATPVRSPEDSAIIGEWIERYDGKLRHWDIKKDGYILPKIGSIPSHCRGFPGKSPRDIKESGKPDPELVYILQKGNPEPRPIYDITQSILYFLSNYELKYVRVYAPDYSKKEDFKKIWSQIAQPDELHWNQAQMDLNKLYKTLSKPNQKSLCDNVKKLCDDTKQSCGREKK